MIFESSLSFPPLLLPHIASIESHYTTLESSEITHLGYQLSNFDKLTQGLKGC